MLIDRTQEDKNYIQSIGSRIKKAREDRRYTQKELGQALGYAEKSGNYSVSLIEKGEVATIDIVILKRISNFLQVPLIELIDGD